MAYLNLFGKSGDNSYLKGELYIDDSDGIIIIDGRKDEYIIGKYAN